MLLRIVLAVIGLIWVFGTIWGWRQTAGEGQTFWWRVLLAVFWPLTWLVEKFGVVQALTVGCAIAAFLAAAHPAPAWADQMVFRNQAWIVRLTHAPCAVPAIESQFKEAGVEKVEATDVDEIGAHTHIRGCWALVPTDNGLRVLAIDEEGGAGLLPFTAFQIDRDL